MTNADKFKSLFGLYATELWAMPEKDFLKWLNSEATNCSEFPNNSDTISRQAAVDAISKIKRTDNWQAAVSMALLDLPSAQPEIIRCKDCKHWDGVDTCDVIDAPVWDNDFCSLAERRSHE